MEEVELHEYQTKAFQSQARFVAIIAGTGGGKTFFLPIWLLNEIAKNPQEQFFVVSPTFSLFQRTTFPECKKRLDRHIGGIYKEQKKRYELSTGGIVYFGSADNPDSLEGGQMVASAIDEAGQIKLASWQAIQRRLGVKMGRCLITTTPYGLNWLYKDFYLRWKNGDPDYDVIQFESINNPYYPKEEYERAKRTLDSRIFDMRYRGLFRKLSGLVYPDFNQENVINPFEIPKEWTVFGGIDFGYNNPFVALQLVIDKDDNIYLIDEYYQSGKYLREHAEHLRKDIIYYCDPSAKQDIEELKSINIQAESANNEVDRGIEMVGSLIKSKRLKVFKTCRNFLDEIETYHRDEKDKIVKKDDHCMDNIRYAILTFMKERNRKESYVYVG
jgi:PBSX family phage terminase large subunit